MPDYVSPFDHYNRIPFLHCLRKGLLHNPRVFQAVNIHMVQLESSGLIYMFDAEARASDAVLGTHADCQAPHERGLTAPQVADKLDYFSADYVLAHLFGDPKRVFRAE